ncbi:MAG: HIT domain-containing protein [Gammaproteobacteria bacterium]|nr:HIT domain-containing protein [Gammaproteobacteria bacterium]
MFELAPEFIRDSVLVTKLKLCQVRLQNDQRFPWLVLIPEVNEVTEVHQLSQQQQNQLIQESCLVSSTLKALTQSTKINVANLGNVVAQLHWHVVARFEDDEAWPGPIWGVGSAVPYPDQKRAEFIDSFVKALNSAQ